MNTSWRKRIAIWRNRLYLYPAPDALPHTTQFWLATACVVVLVALFSTFFILYLTARHTAFMTNAEDLGIMDQAVWNTLHGNFMHQTICNILHDTNCTGVGVDGVSRLAIHFEPILFLVSLFYLVWPDPRTLLVIQTLIVAAGAFPAFWLARLRLRNEWAALSIAAVYLLYPAQQFALVNDFHAVTLTAALLLFTLYFMYTRRTGWLFVFAILSMACKEEIPAVIIMFGLWSIVFQHRVRSGLSLVAIALLWLGAFWLAARVFSPTGHPLLASRYDYLFAGKMIFHPGTLLRQRVLEHTHIFYLRTLLTPAGYLPLLAPWILVLALPSIALNLFSTDANMYSGMFQYNAEIVPVLIFSAIEAIVLIIWLAQWVVARASTPTEGEHKARPYAMARPTWTSRWLHFGLLIILCGYALAFAYKADAATPIVPFGQGFTWPQQSAHTALAQQFIDSIPADASVSAQSALAPHLSHRTRIYLYPYNDRLADYIFLDVTGDIYPFYTSYDYIHETKRVLLSGSYGIVAAQDGYILLKRGLTPPGLSPNSLQGAGIDVSLMLPNMPQSFCSFINSSQQQAPHALQVTFAGASTPQDTLNLVGYNVAVPSKLSTSAGYLQVSTYWQVNMPTHTPFQVVVFLIDQAGAEHFVTSDAPAFVWCPTNTWAAGTVVYMPGRIVHTPGIAPGLVHVAIAVLPLAHAYSTIMNVQDRLALQILHAPAAVSPTLGTNGLQLTTTTIIP